MNENKRVIKMKGWVGKGELPQLEMGWYENMGLVNVFCKKSTKSEWEAGTWPPDKVQVTVTIEKVYGEGL